MVRKANSILLAFNTRQHQEYVIKLQIYYIYTYALHFCIPGRLYVLRFVYFALFILGPFRKFIVVLKL